MTPRGLVIILLLGLLPPTSLSWAGITDEFPKEYLSEIVRHLYRWNLDETALLPFDNTPTVEFLVRPLSPKLDAGDFSQYCEVLIPQLGYVLRMKRADYEVPEMKLHIENSNFRILNVDKYDAMPAPREAYQAMSVPSKELMDHLFATRSMAEPIDSAMKDRLHRALREQMNSAQAGEEQTIYVAPMSMMTNDLWVFWESRGKIIRFTSDTDLTTNAYWDYEKLGVRVYDLKKNVVVSLAETAGSSSFVTRDWAARVLFNCVVLGQRVTLTP